MPHPLRLGQCYGWEVESTMIRAIGSVTRRRAMRPTMLASRLSARSRYLPVKDLEERRLLDPLNPAG